MRRALVLLTVLGLMVLTVALVAAVSGLAGVAQAAISSIKPASGETTPGGTVRATVTVDSGILTTCLTATSDDLNITVTFDGLALSCGKGTWSSDMKVSVSALIEPGLYTVHVQEVDLLGSVLQSHPWPLTVTAPTTTTTSTTTTTTTLITLPPPTLPKLGSTTSTTTTTAPTNTRSTTTTVRTASTTTTTTADLEAGGSTTTIDSGETTTTVVAGAGGDDDDPGGGGAGAGLRSGLRQTSIGVGGDVPRGLFGPTPEVLSFEVTAGYANAVELIEASWVWVLGLALMIAAALIKGIDRRLDHEPAPDSEL